jgi:hypothetical protein
MSIIVETRGYGVHFLEALAFGAIQSEGLA